MSGSAVQYSLAETAQSGSFELAATGSGKAITVQILVHFNLLRRDLPG